MKRTLIESDRWTAPHKVDPEKGIIYDVKVCGLESKNQNDYTPQVFAKSLKLYEGIRCNIDHKERGKQKEDRKVIDRFGRLKECRVESDGLYGNLHYNPKHPLSECVAWWAANDPEALGLSQVAIGDGRRKPNGRHQVESITSVFSVDLVADSATTKSLHESEEPKMEEETSVDQESRTPDEELALLKKEKSARLLCESHNITPDQQLLDILSELDEEKQKALLLREAQRTPPAKPGVKPRSTSPVHLRDTTNSLAGKTGKDLVSALRKMR
jgi:hypothetical protein